jgi:hypothetical protein
VTAAEIANNVLSAGVLDNAVLPGKHRVTDADLVRRTPPDANL